MRTGAVRIQLRRSLIVLITKFVSIEATQFSLAILLLMKRSSLSRPLATSAPAGRHRSPWGLRMAASSHFLPFVTRRAQMNV